MTCQTFQRQRRFRACHCRSNKMHLRIFRYRTDETSSFRRSPNGFPKSIRARASNVKDMGRFKRFELGRRIDGSSICERRRHASGSFVSRCMLGDACMQRGIGVVYREYHRGQRTSLPLHHFRSFRIHTFQEHVSKRTNRKARNVVSQSLHFSSSPNNRDAAQAARVKMRERFCTIV